MEAACRNLQEDVVKYKLFPSLRSRNKPSTGSETLDLFAENYILKLSSYLCQYIWQDQSFNLSAVHESAEVPAHLEGSTCFGDSIEDEWFIVFLLFQLTQEDPDLVIKVEDNDGDFLLIEAADFLPKWVNPETSENRVFIYRGSLHLIPIAQSPAEITPIPGGTPAIADAVCAVRQFTTVTQASPSVQQAVQQRIQCYPQKIKELHHRAHCHVPASVAAILTEEPSLLSAAVKAFYCRDPYDLKACRAMKYFPPETRVMTEVVFTRCLYAQLASQKYEPDRCTGWDLPVINDPQFKSHDLGMKLACGFEILVSKVQKSNDNNSEVKNVDFQRDVRWKRFVNSLKEKGYFRGELEGSKLHTQLLNQAKDFYLASLRRKSCDITPGEQVLALLEKLTINYDEMKKAEQFLRKPDVDDWMNITLDQLDSTLESIANRNSSASIATAIPSTLKNFLYQTSGIDGVEQRPRATNRKKKQKVPLEAEAFTEAVSNILDFRVPNSDDDSDSSSMSGYSGEDSDVELGEESKNAKNKIKSSSDAQKVVEEMKAYMDQMDRELAQTNVGQSFERVQPGSMNGGHNSESDDIDAEEDDFRPVDVNLTALKNILESYSDQSGLPGPAGNLFASMGLRLPDDMDS